MRDAGKTQEVSALQKLVDPWNKKGKLARAKRGPQHRPFPDWALLGRGGRGRTRAPGYPARDLGCGRAGSGRGVDAAAPVAPPP